MSWIYLLTQVCKDIKSRFTELTQNLRLEGRVIVKTYTSFVTLNLKFNADSVRRMNFLNNIDNKKKSDV